MMILPLRDAPELGGSDPIDARLGLAPSLPAKPRGPRWLRLTLALGLAPTPVPGLILLPLGIALGPHGLNVLSVRVVAYLDPVVPVALAALGIFIGLGLRLRRPRETGLVVAASLEAAVTVLVVSGGVFAARDLLWPDSAGPLWFVVLTLGICASASSSVSGAGQSRASVLASRIGELDDVLPVILGGLMLVWLRTPLPLPALALFGQTLGVALAIALAGWLLVADVASDSEQRVFAVGALLLLAGVAEYLSLSALLIGFVAGVFWNISASPVRDRFERDVRHLQHPLVVLVLLLAGARVTVTPGLAALAVAYVLFRIVGKVVGGWFAGRVAAPVRPVHLGVRLISPGVIGIAFALNALDAGPPDIGERVLAVVVIGSLLSELFSLLVHPAEDQP